jgi:hypothetical protein
MSDSVASLQAEVNRLQTELSAVHHDDGEMIYIGEYICRRLIQLGVTVRLLLTLIVVVL